MSRHATVEELSSLLDRELEVASRDRVERHLAACHSCSGRLEGLRSVVSELARLQRVAPPPTLGREVGRRIRWESPPRGALGRIERRVRSMTLQPSVAPVFAFVVALAAIMIFFVSGLERRQRGTPVHLEAPGAGETGAGETQVVSATREVAGRTFELREGLWVEEGVGDRAPAARFRPTDPEAGPWLPKLPDPADLAVLGGPVRVLAGDEVVELRFEP